MKDHERLKLVRKALNLTQLEFCEVIGIKQGSYSDVERGKASISSSLIKTLLSKFNVDPLWLLDGKGSMFVEGERSHLQTLAATSRAKNKIEKSLEFNQQQKYLSQQQKALKSLDDIIDFLK